MKTLKFMWSTAICCIGNVEILLEKKGMVDQWKDTLKLKVLHLIMRMKDKKEIMDLIRTELVFKAFSANFSMKLFSNIFIVQVLPLD